jgi:O-antigen biosynthesis protein
VIAVLVGIIVGEVRLAAVIALVVLVVVSGYVAALAVQGLSHRVREAGGEGGMTGVSAVVPLDADLIDPAWWNSPSTRRRTAVRVLARERWATERSFDVAFHSRSHLAGEVLAGLATHHRFGLQAVVAIAASGSSAPAIDTVLGPIDGEAGALLARWLLASTDADRHRAGAVLARLLVDRGLDEAVGVATRVRLAHGLLLQGEWLAARRWLDRLSPLHPEVRVLAIDLARATGEFSGAAFDAALGAVFESAALEPVRIDASAPNAFDGLYSIAPPVAHDDDDPLISVVMSCFEPDHSMVAAVRSIIAQTWTRWELLVMDDASTSVSADAVLAEVATLDPRIRVVRAERNSGTYVRRNEAMLLARGSLMTAHDSDDWAHPRRLEVQARHLLASPDTLANVSESLRVGADMRFAQPRASGLRLTEATILFRRDAVIDAIGYYDGVRRAADSEFRLRLEAATGRPVPVVRVGAPLTLVRSRVESLSGGDFADQWMHPARVAYRSAMAHWLSGQLVAGRPARIDHPQLERSFPAHAHLTGTAMSDAAFDVLVIGDTRVSGSFARDRIPELLEAASAHGVRVAVRRLEDIGRGGPRTATAEPIQRLISMGRVVEVLATDDVDAHLLVVAGDRCLLGLGDRDLGIRTSLVYRVAEAEDELSIVLDEALERLVGTDAAASAATVSWSTVLAAVARAERTPGPTA